MGVKLKLAVRLISVALTMIMVMQIVPMQVFAKSVNETKKQEQKIEQDRKLKQEKEQKPKGEIIGEVKEKRDEYTKVYKCDDNTYTAVISTSPLHYEKNGTWEEIDNSLEQKAGNNSKLVNINNKFNVEFPDEMSTNNGVSIICDGYNISFSIDKIKSSNAQVRNNKKTKSESKNMQDEALSKLSSSVVYKNIFKNEFRCF